MLLSVVAGEELKTDKLSLPGERFDLSSTSMFAAACDNSFAATVTLLPSIDALPSSGFNPFRPSEQTSCLSE